MTLRALLKLLALSSLLLPAILLLTFGPRAGEEVPPDRIVVEYWEKWTGAEEQQMRSIVNEFNETVGREKNIYVRYMSTTAINQKTLVATAAGVPPDIAGLWESNVVQYAAQDALEPLEDLAREKGISSETYKKVYWEQCNYDGHLYALISTPAAVVLHYNRLIFESEAQTLRDKGLDPTCAPRSIAELDAYADALTKKDARGHIQRAGYFPMEPNWYIPQVWMWFGADVFDQKTQKFTLTDPKFIAAYDWIASYTRKFGKDAANDFRGGLSTAFDSPQNAFLVNFVCMEWQGPWMANYIDHLRPDLQRLQWPREEEMKKPILERRKNYFWAVAPFPDSAGLGDVTYASCDILCIPRGAKHKREAFEFIAYVNRQDVMERLCMMHSKNSPLANVSERFLAHHPNPYIDVFEKMARSPHARGVPQVPIWQEVADELTSIGQAMALGGDARSSLELAQTRLQASYDNYMAIQRAPARHCQSCRKRLKIMREAVKGYAFISPWIVGFLAFTLIPIGLSIYYSFCDYSLLQPPVFKGVGNYTALLHDKIFWLALRNTLVYALMALPLGLISALAMAILLNANIHARASYRAIIFLPSIVPASAAAMVWLWILNPKLGLVNLVLRHLGMQDPPGWIADKSWALPALAFLSIWSVGRTVVIYLAGLQDVPLELYEAADIDGATAWRKIWHVTLPSISPVIFFNLIIAIIGTMNFFVLPFIMTQGGPDRATYFFTYYLYDNAFIYLKMGYASAMAVVQLLIVLALTGVAFGTSRHWVHYSGK